MKKKLKKKKEEEEELHGNYKSKNFDMYTKIRKKGPQM